MCGRDQLLQLLVPLGLDGAKMCHFGRPVYQCLAMPKRRHLQRWSRLLHMYVCVWLLRRDVWFSGEADILLVLAVPARGRMLPIIEWRVLDLFVSARLGW